MRVSNAISRGTLLAAAFLASLFLGFAPTASAWAADYQSGITDANMRQLVIVVRFAGDTTGDNNDGLNRPYSTTVPSEAAKYRTEWDWTLRNLNAKDQTTAELQSVYSYMKTVSEDQCRLESVSPQTDGATGKVAYLTLPDSIKSYSEGTPDTVVAAAVDAFAAAYPSFNWRSLDMDGDGCVDNVLVIPEVGDGKIDGVAIGSNSSLWSRQGFLGNAKVVGSGGTQSKVSSFTLVNTANLAFVGTLSHETMHTQGAKDLYRIAAATSDGTPQPVGVWDIMAKHGTRYLMWPLAITRQDCGWLTLSERQLGSHTLYAPGSGRQQAVVFKSPVNPTEYFVAEYRKATTTEADIFSLDHSDTTGLTIGGSGLIVYRVNPAVKADSNGNKGEKDYVYLYRSGETTTTGVRGDGMGDIKNAQLSMAGRKVLGTSDMAKGLVEGAVTFSDGQNSGLVFTVTGQTADSITFSVTCPSGDDLGVWSPVTDANGTVPFATASSPATAVATDGTALYIAAADERTGSCRVWKHSGTRWSAVGVQLSGIVQPTLCWHGGSLYLAGQSSTSSGSPTGRLVVKRFDGARWADVGSVPSVANVVQTPLASVGSKLVALAAPSASTLQAYEVGQGLVSRGSSMRVTNPANAVLFNGAGKMAVAVGENTGAGSTSLFLQTGAAWKKTKVFDQISSVLSATSFKGAIYLYSYTFQSAQLARVGADGVPAARATLSSLATASLGGALVAAEKNLYLGYLEGADPRAASCVKVNADSLSLAGTVGARVCSGGGALALTAMGNKLFCALPELTAGKVTVRSHVMPDGDKALPVSSGSSSGGGSGSSSGSSGAAGSGGSTGSAGSAGSTGNTVVTPAPASPAPTGAWRHDGRGWWYQYWAGGYPAGTWQLIEGAWYHFNGAGYMETGWIRDGGTWYYLYGSGAMATGWLFSGGAWYYLDGGSGAMATGWRMVDGTWYYLYGSGAMATGWLRDGGTWYYLHGSGAMATGWVQTGGAWYYLHGSGAMATNQWVEDRYWVTGSGAWTNTR